MIGSKEQRNHVPKEDVCSPRMLEEAVMPTCAQKERDEAVVSIPNECAQTVTSVSSHTQLVKFQEWRSQWVI